MMIQEFYFGNVKVFIGHPVGNGKSLVPGVQERG